MSCAAGFLGVRAVDVKLGPRWWCSMAFDDGGAGTDRRVTSARSRTGRCAHSAATRRSLYRLGLSLAQDARRRTVTVPRIHHRQQRRDRMSQMSHPERHSSPIGL